MHEQKKLEEAQHFLERMDAIRNDPTAFRRELSAFLSSSRSMLQYLNREACTRPGGHKRYDDAVANRSVITLMKRERDTNIHAEPVMPDNDVMIGIQAGVVATGSLGLVRMDNEGQILDQRSPDSVPAEVAAKPAVEVEYNYYFGDARAAGNVLSLCRSYLNELHSLVVDGRGRGVITP